MPRAQTQARFQRRACFLRIRDTASRETAPKSKPGLGGLGVSGRRDRLHFQGVVGVGHWRDPFRRCGSDRFHGRGDGTDGSESEQRSYLPFFPCAESRRRTVGEEFLQPRHLFGPIETAQGQVADKGMGRRVLQLPQFLEQSGLSRRFQVGLAEEEVIAIVVALPQAAAAGHQASQGRGHHQQRETIHFTVIEAVAQPLRVLKGRMADFPRGHLGQGRHVHAVVVDQFHCQRQGFAAGH